ncbi:hypothetical protein FB45DRAFT_107225 [Roridomyces roridus]|uniref:Uncharacterized protein n=1 Tax=Roridomyces roridus TaxID=1738132 RepID=A0AAD7BK38_9AGAR|nr:hypothetical protein FB45DRAFT_107225 [Roridomyces roridus]
MPPVTLVSPSKPNRTIHVPAISVSAIDRHQRRGHPSDRSWDSPAYVEIYVQHGRHKAKRSRKWQRHRLLKDEVDVFRSSHAQLNAELQALKALVLKQQDTVLKQQDTISEHHHQQQELNTQYDRRFRKQELVNGAVLKESARTSQLNIERIQLVEEFECIDRALDFFETRVFDALHPDHARVLQRENLDRLYKLLRYQPQPRLAASSGGILAKDAAYGAARDCLTTREWELAKLLQGHRRKLAEPRNRAQHPPPTRQAAQYWLSKRSNILPYHAECRPYLQSLHVNISALEIVQQDLAWIQQLQGEEMDEQQRQPAELAPVESFQTQTQPQPQPQLPRVFFPLLPQPQRGAAVAPVESAVQPAPVPVELVQTQLQRAPQPQPPRVLLPHHDQRRPQSQQ